MEHPAFTRRPRIDCIGARGRRPLAVRDASKLLFRSRLPPGELGVAARVTPRDAGWSMLGVETRRLAARDVWSFETGESEAILVVLGGVGSVSSSRGEWAGLGKRANVFAGMPHALYLPRRTTVAVTAESDVLEIAHAWAPSDEDHPPRRITPSDVAIEVRGGGGATRQINSILPPGSDCQRLVCVEVFTPGGNWSSYPPHKHDAHVVGANGNVLEADLEEIYLYKMADPRGWAVQRVYTGDRSIDEAVVVGDGDVVLVPEGYHPVAAAHGYDCYYLNVLAGSAQSLACAFDPDHERLRERTAPPDPRVPLVTHTMEERAGR
jgi:5-deoxy-glucuronate isomerase